MWIIVAIKAFFGGTNPPVRKAERDQVWECHKSGDESNGSGVQASVGRFLVESQGGNHSSHPGSSMIPWFWLIFNVCFLVGSPKKVSQLWVYHPSLSQDRFIPSRRTCVRVGSGLHQLEPAAALLFAETPRLTLWFSSGQVNRPNPPWFANSANRCSRSVLL